MRIGKLHKAIRDESGSILPPFAVGMFGVLLTVGSGVDAWRIFDSKSVLQQAVDSAVLAAAQSTAPDLAGAQAAADKVFQANLAGAAAATFTLTKPSAGVFTGTATATIQTTFMRVAGVNSVAISSSAEAQTATGGPIEVALALDNTGSMSNDMAGLRTAATDLVNTLFNSASGNANFKMSVVPFVAAVNPGRTALEAGGKWMLDTGANSRHHAERLEWQWIARRNGCTPNWGGGGGGGGGNSGPGSGGSGASIEHLLPQIPDLLPVTRFAARAFGVGAALADSDSSVTANTVRTIQGVTQSSSLSGVFKPNGGFYVDTGGGCEWLGNPGKISHFDLFARIATTTTTGATFGGWKGCVEARPNKTKGASKDWDVTDDPPTASDSDSLFVPYFWPDEIDPYETWVPAYANNYLPDGSKTNGVIDMDPTGNPQGLSNSKKWNFTDDYWMHFQNLFKYDKVNKAVISETGPDTSGPNKACPDEVLPLTNVQQTVLNKISGLTYWNGGGTIISEGLMWAWRTLSPNAPYANAKPYAEGNTKVIVLMTDGKNELGENGRDKWGGIDGSPVYSHYSAYGYLRGGRFPAESFSSATTSLNDRLSKACANAKAKGVVIYTVLFRETDASTQALLKACATKADYAFLASNTASLASSFSAIGSSITKLRLSK